MIYPTPYQISPDESRHDIEALREQLDYEESEKIRCCVWTDDNKKVK